MRTINEDEVEGIRGVVERRQCVIEGDVGPRGAEKWSRGREVLSRESKIEGCRGELISGAVGDAPSRFCRYTETTVSVRRAQREKALCS